jgi:hypothetical protein
VPIPDDERFEAYLRQFRPLAPESLPTGLGHASRRRFVIAAGGTAAAAVLILMLARHIRSNPTAVSVAVSNASAAGELVPSQPLTMRSANALLAAAPSFKTAVDAMAFHSQTIPLPEGQRSAVSVLSKEKIKL